MRTHLQTRIDSAPAIPDRPVLYDPVFDEYCLVSDSLLPDRDPIRRCPWCGTRLPPSRRDQWYDELVQLGITPDDPALPPQFLTDAWWEP